MMNKSLVLIFSFIVFLSSSLLAENNLYEIKADRVKYTDGSSTVIAEGNAHAFSNDGKNLYADKIIYKKKNNLIQSFGNSKYSDGNNTLEAHEFFYDLKLETIEARGNVLLIDQEKNKYNFKEFKYYEKTQKGNAFQLRSNLNDGSYLKSKNANIDNKKSILELNDAEYTTCSKINNSKGKFCPSWSLKSKKIIHDKNKKRITHKNAFLRIKNIPVLYTPYITHPDPTVKRQSGFLPPMIKTISGLGRTIKAPYFWAISKDKDLTITPIYYFDERHMIQSSYRQAFKDGNLRIENAYTEGYKRLNKTGRTGGSRNYFFAEYDGKKNGLIFKNNEIKLKLQRISQQNFARVNKINTRLFKQDIRTLENTIKIATYEGSKRLEIKTGIFENLNISDNSKYTYYLPDGIFSYNTKKIKNFNTNINSYFQGRKFSNDQKQGKVRNIISLNSDQNINNKTGFASVLKATFYNNNIFNNNVSNQKEDESIDNYFTIASDVTYPLAKIRKYSYHTLTPRVFAKYTSGKMQNANANNKILNYSDIFSMNRTNNLDTPETGSSIGHGIDYSFNKNNEEFKTIYSTKLGIGQVLRTNRLDNMPTKSSLNNKSSDYAGFINHNLYGKKIIHNVKNPEKLSYLDNFDKNNLGVSYNFNIENDLGQINRNDFKVFGTYNKFYSSLNFEEKNNHVGNGRNAILNLKSLIADNYYFSYDGKRNLKTDSSEYHKLAINFENDCLITSLTLSRNFYYDKDVTSSKTLIFGVLIKPFSDNFAPDLTDFIE